MLGCECSLTGLCIHFSKTKVASENITVLIFNVVAINKQTLYLYSRHIIKTEGIKSLFRGLGPNLVGVAPSR